MLKVLCFIALAILIAVPHVSGAKVSPKTDIQKFAKKKKSKAKKKKKKSSRRHASGGDYRP